jgi:hypothetical protein
MWSFDTAPILPHRSDLAGDRVLGKTGLRPREVMVNVGTLIAVV